MLSMRSCGVVDVMRCGVAGVADVVRCGVVDVVRCGVAGVIDVAWCGVVGSV